MHIYNMNNRTNHKPSGRDAMIDSEAAAAAVADAGRRNGVHASDLDTLFLLAFVTGGCVRMGDLSREDAARVRHAVGV
jgi:hypothetical protein